MKERDRIRKRGKGEIKEEETKKTSMDFGGRRIASSVMLLIAMSPVAPISNLQDCGKTEQN